MADEPDSPLTPAQDEEVRRLLAGARHDTPMPPEVVDRMDRVLDDLAAEPGRAAPVVDLATRAVSCASDSPPGAAASPRSWSPRPPSS